MDRTCNCQDEDQLDITSTVSYDQDEDQLDITSTVSYDCHTVPGLAILTQAPSSTILTSERWNSGAKFSITCCRGFPS